MNNPEVITPTVTETDVFNFLKARLAEVPKLGNNQPFMSACHSEGGGRFNIMVFNGETHISAVAETFAGALVKYIEKTDPLVRAAKLRAEANELLVEASLLAAPPALADETSTAAAPCTDEAVHV